MTLRRLALLTTVLTTLAACANAPTGSGVGGEGIEHGTAPTELLVRIAHEGGFVPIEWNHTNMPVFSLYGDGTLVVPGAQIAIYPGPALPAISRRHLTEAGIQAILRETLDATRDLPSNLDDMGTIAIADAATTVITLSAGGVERTVRVYALGELLERPDGMAEEVFRARQELQALVTKLTGLDPWLPEGSFDPEEPYMADAASVFVTGYRTVEDLPQDPATWPLDGELGGFGSPTETKDGYRCGRLAGQEWATVRRSATAANELTPWVDGAGEFRVLFRPLLPDETGC